LSPFDELQLILSEPDEDLRFEKYFEWKGKNVTPVAVSSYITYESSELSGVVDTFRREMCHKLANSLYENLSMASQHAPTFAGKIYRIHFHLIAAPPIDGWKEEVK
jgi:hypothetical protein